MYTQTSILLFLFFCMLNPAGAQQYAFRNITTDEGLPTSECYHVMQDRKGYIWVSSNAGLGKYNGRTFRTFTTEDGLTDNIVFKTFEDDQGRLFYITGNTRIGYLKNDTAFTMPVTDTLARLMSQGKFFIYEICNYDKERFLISTQRGFYTLDKKTLSRLEAIPGMPGAAFWLKVIDGKASGSYCFEVSSGMHRMDKYNFYVEINGKSMMIPIELERSGSGSSIFRTCCLADGRVLAGFSNKIVVINPDETYTMKKLPFPVTAISQDKNKGVWVCMLNNGLYYYPCEKGNKKVCFDDEPQHLFAGESPTAALTDNEGGVWVSTLYNGIYYCPNLGIVNYTNIKQLSTKLYSLNSISSYVLTNGLNNTLFAFKNKNDFREITLPPGKEINGAYSYYKKGNKIYAAGYSSSYVLDSSLELSKIVTDRNKSSMFIYNLAEDKDKKLIGVRFSELVYFANDTIFSDMALPSRGRDIATDGAGRVYVATNKGLYIRENGHLTMVPDMRVRINKLKCGPHSRVWVCSDGKGLIEMDGMRAVKRYTTADGLASDICYDVAFEGRHAWIATNKGLCCLNTDRPGQIFTYKKQNGLLNNEIFKVCVKDNEIYISTQKGLCIADLSTLHPNLHAPRIYLTDVLSGNQSALKNSSFSYDQNNFEFVAEGISFQNPQGISYEYRLNGYDTAWKVNTTGSMTYNNLDDGSYTFEVKSVNADGVKSTETAAYSFVIQKPFWERVWFILLLVLAFAGFVYLIVSLRVSSVKKREARKSYFNRLMAEYHMSALRAQMNPHFIFNAINSIQHYILSNEKQYAYDYLTKFSILIRQVLANSQHNITTLEKELEMLELYIGLEQRRFKSRFDYEICYPGELNPDEIKIPVMLVQPFVENAIWHGIMNLPEEKKGRLSVTVECEKDVLKISVEDNGVGRKRAAGLKTDNGHAPVGMLLSQERLEILKVIGSGDTRIVVTDLEDAEGPCGTRVDIFLTLTV
ncbi:MAG: signal transduction histidine kinase, LytS [Bacteroidetes bacterium]|nr:signal transduction histidine kinase, LytS [Bacteroidota bacterium]